MKIRIIYIITIILILSMIGITVYYNYLTKDRCPASCERWIYGSCIDKQLYLERVCYNYTGNCIQQIYYERKIETVEACSQADCREGNFVNYSCG